MKKIYLKLVAMALALVMSLVAVGMTSYAWFVLSDSPMVNGIQVAIGGGSTILIAADLTKTVDGTVYHYPDVFDDTLNFSQHASYAYLSQLGGLSPVSTADGLHWVLPTYYQSTDSMVQAGLVPAGQLRDVAAFAYEEYLQHANLPAGQDEQIAEGSYIYLDFWVVSPGADYTLHVSTDYASSESSTGSFVIDLPQPKADGQGGFALAQSDSKGAAAVRIGFLANPNRITDATMEYYQDSYSFNDKYTQLRGVYHEPNLGYRVYSDEYRFTVYEPNADWHPYDEALDGSYVTTYPVGLVDDQLTAVQIFDDLTVQKRSGWVDAENGDGTALAQRFSAAFIGQDLSDAQPEVLAQKFYKSYLQWQLSPYVTKGGFVRSTGDLRNAVAADPVIPAEKLGSMTVAGATDDVYIIELERNVPQRIRMFIWLEGQDVDCIDSVRSSNLAVNIEIAGSSGTN